MRIETRAGGYKVKFFGEKSWKRKTEEISEGVESSTDKTQTEKLLLETV